MMFSLDTSIEYNRLLAAADNEIVLLLNPFKKAYARAVTASGTVT
jgi:hypothetical protein